MIIWGEFRLYGNCTSECSKDRVPFRRAAFGIAYGIGGAHEKSKKARIAFAQVIIQSMWVKGLITTAERNKIALKTEEKLQKNNC